MKSEFENKILCHRDSVRQFILTKTKNNIDLSEDIVQMTFIKAFMYFKNGNTQNVSYKNWLYKIAVNLLIDYISHKKNNNLNFYDLTYDKDKEFEIQDSFSYDKYIDTIVYKDIIQKGMKELSIYKPQLYNVFVKSIDCENYSEIASAENIPLNTVKTRVSRARKFMQKYLENSGLNA